MIRLTRLNGSEMYLNADLVATVESHHDTVVTLVDGKTYVVVESADQVVTQIRSYRASILAAAERFLADEEHLDLANEEGAQVLHLRPADGGC